MFSDIALAIKCVGIAGLSESHARRAKRQNYASFKMAKKEERLGRERKKDDRGSLIVL